MDFTTLVLGILLGASCGSIATYVIMRGGDQQALRDKYDALKATHEAYQVNVNNHFSQTSEMLESLNERYQAVNLHIAKGMDELTSNDAHLSQSRSAEGHLPEPEPPASESQDENPSAPRDYA